MADVNVRIRIHADTLTKAIQKRVEDLKDKVLSDEMKYRAAEIYRDCVEPYVPMEYGNLRKSAHIGKKYNGDYPVIYGNSDVKYAKAQYKGYNGRGAIREYTTPGTYDHWNKHLSRGDREAMYDLIAEEIVEKMNNG